MHLYSAHGQDMAYKMVGKVEHNTAVIWAHGWGASHMDFMPMAETLKPLATHYVLDLPGHGQSPMPSDVWAPKDYADYCYRFLQSLPHEKIIWVGHSFGCRVGVNIAAKYPDIFERMVLIAAAGLKRKRPIHKRIEYAAKVKTYKALKKMVPLKIVSEDWLKSKFGSADYRNASSVMRNILVATVNEHLEAVAPNVQCPVTLIYGSKDDQTPVNMGQKYEKLIPQAKLVVLDGYDHYTVLTNGRHQILYTIKPLIS